VNLEGRNPGLERVKFSLRTTGIPAEPPSPLRSGVHSRGFLPHVKREGASYFVTFRLADSLPKQVLLRFQSEHAEALRQLPPMPNLNRQRRPTANYAGKSSVTSTVASARAICAGLTSPTWLPGRCGIFTAIIICWMTGS